MGAISCAGVGVIERGLDWMMCCGDKLSITQAGTGAILVAESILVMPVLTPEGATTGVVETAAVATVALGFGHAPLVVIAPVHRDRGGVTA